MELDTQCEREMKIADCKENNKQQLQFRYLLGEKRNVKANGVSVVRQYTKV